MEIGEYRFLSRGWLKEKKRMNESLWGSISRECSFRIGREIFSLLID